MTFADCVYDLIKLNEKFRADRDKEKEFHSPLGFHLRYRTVRCNAGRQTGKTSAIIMMAEKNDLIIFRYGIAKDYKDVCRTMQRESLREGYDYSKINRIWIDDVDGYNEDDLLDIYTTILNDNTEHLFILLG